MEESKHITKRIDTGLIIGIIAIVINIITVSVYIYQAKIMETQQHAAAWPYVEWLPSINEEDGFFIEVSNNGIGPALIKSVTIKLDGKEVANQDSLFMKLVGTTKFPLLFSTVENRVLPAGQSIKPYQVSNVEWAYKIYEAMGAHRFEYIICYESIYGDSWTCRGTEVVEGICK